MAEKLEQAAQAALNLENEKLKEKVCAFPIPKSKQTVEQALTRAGTTLEDSNTQDQQSKKTPLHHRIKFFKPTQHTPVVEFKLKTEKTGHKEVYDAICKLKAPNIKR